MRWPEGATSLGPKPSLFFLFVCGGLKSQARWPKGPPHLALNFLIFLFCFLGFCFCFFLKTKMSPPPKKNTFCLLVQFLPCFVLSLFSPPLLTFFLLHFWVCCFQFWLFSLFCFIFFCCLFFCLLEQC